MHYYYYYYYWIDIKKKCAAQFPGIFKIEYTNSKETYFFFSVRAFQKINYRGPRYHTTLHFECKVDRPFVIPNANNSCFEYTWMGRIKSWPSLLIHK